MINGICRLYHNISRDNLLLSPGFAGSVRTEIAKAAVEGAAMIEGVAASRRISSNLIMSGCLVLNPNKTSQGFGRPNQGFPHPVSLGSV